MLADDGLATLLGQMLFRACSVDLPRDANGLGLAKRGPKPLKFCDSKEPLAAAFRVLLDEAGRIGSVGDKAPPSGELVH